MIHKPIHDRIIIKKIDVEFKTKGGLFLGEIEKERETAYCKVIAVGPGKQVDGAGRIPMTVKVGDVIICNERIPTKINIAGEVLHVLRESDVMEILEEEYDGELSEKEYKTEGYEFDASGAKLIGG